MIAAFSFSGSFLEKRIDGSEWAPSSVASRRVADLLTAVQTSRKAAGTFPLRLRPAIYDKLVRQQCSDLSDESASRGKSEVSRTYGEKRERKQRTSVPLFDIASIEY